MKYILVVGDGMADEPITDIGNMTPLEAAVTENMDLLAKDGIVGLVRTVPEGFKPGSDVANLGLLGYDPSVYYPGGRGPIEAASLGVALDDEDCAFRCNLVTVQDDRMVDFSSGYIATRDSGELIALLNTELADESIRFHPGVYYRHVCVLKGRFGGLKCTAPHDITGQVIHEYFPRGEGEGLVSRLMTQSKEILDGSRVNTARLAAGEKPATQIWLWGQGHKVELPSMLEKYGVQGSVISAVDLIKGIGKLAGLEVVDVEGATGWIDTNYEGKADSALACLKEKNFVFVHIVSADEAAHTGDVDLKIQAIEDFDKRFLGRLLDKIDGDCRILVLPDHPTPIRTKTHTADPVPFLLYGKGVQADKAGLFSEAEAGKSSLFIERGYELLDLLIGIS